METPYLSIEEQYTSERIVAKHMQDIRQKEITKRLGELKWQAGLKKQFTKGKNTNGNGHYNNITTSHNLSGEIR